MAVIGDNGSVRAYADDIALVLKCMMHCLRPLYDAFVLLASVQLCTLCSHTSVQFCITGETLLIRLDFLFLINM